MSTANALPRIPTLELPHEQAAPGMLGWAERGLLPDQLLRWGTRRLCAQRLTDERTGGVSAQARRFESQLAALRAQT